MLNSSHLGKWLIFIGLGIVIIGILFWASSKIALPFGKLPGDIQVSKERISFYFPIVTSLIFSIVLTIIINLIFWFFRK